MFNKLLANTLYVQVRKNAFRLRHIESKRERELAAARPFTTTRLLIGQFTEADALLRRAIKEVCGGGLFQVSPIIVIHPTDMVEGGLSEIEERAFQELARGVGARKVYVHIGKPLTDAEVMALGQGK